MALVKEQIGQVLRRLAKAPLFTCITLLTLAIAIGANTVVFSVINGVLLKPLNYPQADQLIGVWHKAPGVNLPVVNMGAFLYFTYRDNNATFQDIGCYEGDSVGVTGTGEPENIHAMDVTDGVLPMLGAQPALGRLFTRSDDTPGAPKTIVLSDAYWQKRFGGNPNVIGQSLTVDGTTRTVIGVLPRSFQFLDDHEVAFFIPFQWDRSKTKLGNFSYEGIARLKPSVTMAQASADVARMIPIALRSFPPPQGFDVKVFESAGFQPNLRMLKKDVIGDIGNVLWVLMGSIAVVLLIACANVANLLLVRVEGRRQELSIRTALGANRWSIATQILAESFLLAFAGALIGTGLAYGALRALIAAAPTGLPRLHEIGINLPVLLFTFGMTIFVTFVIGIMPVIKYSGIRASTGLREGGRALSQSRERHRARKTLVVVQVALALVLLICSGLMIRTFRALVHVSPGFADPGSLQTFNIGIPESQIPDTQKERVVRMEQAIVNAISSVQGVQSVSIVTGVPMSGWTSFNPVASEDRIYKEGELPPLRRFKFIGPGYFSTLGTSFVVGRDLTWAETFQKRSVAIISENFAREYWGSPQAALGKHIRMGNGEAWREIIGVVRDTHDDGVDKPAPTIAYWPLYQDHFQTDDEMVRRYVSILIRSPRAGSSAFMHEVQRAVWTVNPELPLADVKTVGELYRKSMARTSFMLVMLSVAGGMALLLGIVGIYGVISYAVSQRTREIGIRMALGAQREAVTTLFLRQGMVLASIGIVVGLGIAAIALRLMSSLLFGVHALDPLTYVLATIGILGIALISSYLPSRRAAVVNPVTALRAE